MTKHIYRLASGLQDQLLGAAMLHPAGEWARLVPRVQLDAWASVWRWHIDGEIITRVTEEMAAAFAAHPLPGDLPLATAPLQSASLGVQLPDRSEWIVIARHAPAPATIPVHGQHHWAYAQPVLTYCASSALGSQTGLASGFVNLIDQPTPRDITLFAGRVTSMETEESRPITDISVDAQRLAIALHALFTAQHDNPRP